MFPASTTTIRPATSADAEMLQRLAGLDSRRPLEGPVLVAEVDGVAVAAIAVDGGRTVADPFRPSAGAVTLLTIRYRALAAGLVDPVHPPRWRRAAQTA